MIRANYAPIFVLYAIYFLDAFGMAVAFPMFAALILDPTFGGVLSIIPLQYRAFLYPLLVAVFPLMQVLAWPTFARLGVKQGRKYILNASLFFLACSFGFTALALFLRSYILLILSRLLSGIFAANFILTTIPAEIGDVRMTQIFHKKLFQMGASGLVLGIFAGGILSDNLINPSFQLYLPFVFTAFFCLVLLCITTYSFSSDPSLDPWAKHLQIFSWKGFNKTVFKSHQFLPFIIFFLLQMTWLSNLQYFSIYIWELFGPYKVFITFILMGMTFSCLIGLYIVYPSLSHILRKKQLLNFSFAGAFFFYLLNLLTKNLFAISFFHIIFALYVGLTWSCIGYYITSPVLQTEYEQVAYKTVAFFLSGVAAAVFGGLFAAINIHFVYLFGCASLLLGLILSFCIDSK